MTLMEIGLNEADQGLRKHEIPISFDNIYFRPHFEEVFKRYDEII